LLTLANIREWSSFGASPILILPTSKPAEKEDAVFEKSKLTKEKMYD